MKVDEIFGPTIQGEGALAGAVSMFVRLGGCDFRCSWCDTMHAVDPANSHLWRELTSAQICDELARLRPTSIGGSWCTISGGNPGIWQHELAELVLELKARRMRVAIETQGSIANEGFRHADLVTFSPKPPSSGMTFDQAKLAESVELAGVGACLKFVVADEADLEFARKVAAIHPALPVWVQPLTVGAPEARAFPTYRHLCEKVANDPSLYEWRVIPQLHVLAWGGERGR
jgi:7-carboxy-7-deazaguanine synthase